MRWWRRRHRTPNQLDEPHGVDVEDGDWRACRGHLRSVVARRAAADDDDLLGFTPCTPENQHADAACCVEQALRADQGGHGRRPHSIARAAGVRAVVCSGS